MSATAVSIANGITTVCSYWIDMLKIRPLITGGVNANKIPLTEDGCGLYVRRDRKNRNRVIGVFDHNGVKCYTIERPTQFTPIWRILEYPSRRDIATVHAGIHTRTIDFYEKKGLQHRELKHSLGSIGRIFYLTDGAIYRWSRASKCLEKVINPGGGDEEVHERLAKARLMRQFRFDYEILYDQTKIDRDVVLATGFVSMITEWGLGAKIETRGPTAMNKVFYRHQATENSMKDQQQEKTKLSGNIGVEENDISRPAEDDCGPCECLTLQNGGETKEITGAVENRIFLIVEKPDGSRTSPLEITQNTDANCNPLLQLTEAPQPDYIAENPHSTGAHSLPLHVS